MRLNKYLAAGSSLSRRGADEAIATDRVYVNGQPAHQGQEVAKTDSVTLDGQLITAETKTITIILNKPRGYVVSRRGQGSRTVYDLLPPEYQQLNPVGRLDKDSSGLLVLTNSGQLSQDLTHPSQHKLKTYEVTLDKALEPLHRQMISDHGIMLDDGPSMLQLQRYQEGDEHRWIAVMHEGRNRQIRRTFAALGYTVTRLHRTNFGPYALDNLATGSIRKM